MSAKEAARGGRRGKNLHRGICISGPFCARVGEMTLPCPAGARRRCKCAYSTLFAPAGRRRFRVGAPDFGVSRRKGACGAVCPSRAVWQARREAENGAVPLFRGGSREKREGLRGFRTSRAAPPGPLFPPAFPRGDRRALPAPAQGSRPLRIPFWGTASAFPQLRPPKTPQAAGPCSWGGCASTRSRRH